LIISDQVAPGGLANESVRSSSI